jgi:hypothetical protein
MFTVDHVEKTTVFRISKYLRKARHDLFSQHQVFLGFVFATNRL